MNKYTYSTEIVIKAENKEDADIELIQKMDDHDIEWEFELVETIS